MARMTEDEIKTIIDQEARQAFGYYSTKLAAARQKAMIYYHGEAKGDLAPPEIDGRSSVVDCTVRNTIEWMMPSLLKTFCAGEYAIEYEAQLPGDEQAAQQATEYENYLFYRRNAGFKVLQTAFRDALLQKAGIVKVWWDNRVTEAREEYRALTDAEMAMILQDEEVEPIEHNGYDDPNAVKKRDGMVQQLQQQLATLPPDQPQAPQPGQPQQASPRAQFEQQLQAIQSQPIPQLHDITVKRSKKGGKLCIENVPPEEFLISKKGKSCQDTPFIAHRVLRSVSDLKSQGYKNVDQISSDDQAAMLSMERVERLQWDDEAPYQGQDDVSTDESQRMVWLLEAYLKADYDGDGIAEWRKVVKAGNQILENEECDGSPFAAFIPITLSHRFFGLSIADMSMEPQKVKTQLIRSLLDNTFLQVNGRYFAVESQVNLDDLLTSRPGGVVRVKNPEAVGRLDQGMTDGSTTMNMVEWFEQYTENATGWTRYSQGLNADALNQTATGINVITNKADQRLELIARNFAEGGMIELFGLIHKLVCQYQDKAEIIRVAGQFVSVDPRGWRNQFDMRINVGLGTGNKDQEVAHLHALLAIQKEALAIGVATPENIYTAAKKLPVALGFKGDFFTDPTQNPQPLQPNPELQMQQARAQADMQIAQVKTQSDERLAQLKAQLDVQVAQAQQAAQAQQMTQQQAIDAQLKREEMQNQLQLEQYKFDRQLQMEREKFLIAQQTAIEVARINAGAKIAAEQVDSAVSDGQQQLEIENT